MIAASADRILRCNRLLCHDHGGDDHGGHNHEHEHGDEAGQVRDVALSVPRHTAEDVVNTSGFVSPLVWTFVGTAVLAAAAGWRGVRTGIGAAAGAAGGGWNRLRGQIGKWRG